MNGTMKDNVPPVEWNVEIRLLFLPVFVANRLKVHLPVFVATSNITYVSESFGKLHFRPTFDTGPVRRCIA